MHGNTNLFGLDGATTTWMNFPPKDDGPLLNPLKLLPQKGLEPQHRLTPNDCLQYNNLNSTKNVIHFDSLLVTKEILLCETQTKELIEIKKYSWSLSQKILPKP
jgi:hypothetical protein